MSKYTSKAHLSNLSFTHVKARQMTLLVSFHLYHMVKLDECFEVKLYHVVELDQCFGFELYLDQCSLFLQGDPRLPNLKGGPSQPHLALAHDRARYQSTQEKNIFQSKQLYWSLSSSTTWWS